MSWARTLRVRLQRQHSRLRVISFFNWYGADLGMDKFAGDEVNELFDGTQRYCGFYKSAGEAAMILFTSVFYFITRVRQVRLRSAR